MLVGICYVELLIYESNSLKDRRRVMKSLIERIKLKFNTSIIEIQDEELWNKGSIGFSVVANNKKLVEKNIMSLINFIDTDGRVEILNKSIEIW